MLPLGEKVILVFVILATAFLFLTPLIRRFRILRAGRPEAPVRNLGRRLGRALSKVALQLCTLKNERPASGLMHVFIFYGALTFDTMTVNHTFEGFFSGFSLFGHGSFARWVGWWVDAAAVLVMIGVLFFAFRRFVLRPSAYNTTPGDSAVIYTLITLATATYLYFEAFAAAAHPETARFGFIGAWLAKTIGASGLGADAVGAHFHLSWWVHIAAVYAFIAYVPHSKYLHMFTGPVNLFLTREEPTGVLRPLDLEGSEVFGLEKAADFTWKDNLDAFACMECGRCQDACPAFASGKPLSPKLILFNQERTLLREGARLRARKREDLAALVPATFKEDEIWTCTTCGACMHVCPVEIAHIPKIVGARQSQVLMESKFPAELTAFFRNIETNSNPWGIGFAKRGDWAAGLDVPLLADRPDAEYLFWVGCLGSFDEGGQKAARAMVAVLKAAHVGFAVLGPEEKCCGDSARRLGNEYVFQSLVQENLATFKKYGVRKLVAICPHGYNTFKHEYPRLAPEAPAVEVVSHVELIDRLIKSGRLSLKPKAGDAAYTFHDSCYLGRHNGLVHEPRSALDAALGARRVELTKTKEHGFCCGGGGGLMWTEEKLGRRVNHLRTEEIIASGVPLAAAACPFCLTMLRDGLKDKERPDIRVADVAELVAEALAAK